MLLISKYSSLNLPNCLLYSDWYDFIVNLTKYFSHDLRKAICVICNLFSVLLREEEQEEIVDWLENTLGDLKTPQISFEFSTIKISDDDLDSTIKSTVCGRLSENISLIIDVTWSGISEVGVLAKKLYVPYLRLDLSISPFLVSLDEYLDYRNSTDVVLIFDDASYTNQLLFSWIDSNRMRMLVSEKLDTAVAKKLKKIRPIPNNFALIAGTQNMMQLFQKALDEGLVTLPERWNLVFTDFQHQNFDRKLIYGKPINLLTLDERVCCNFIGKSPSCSCPRKFNLQQEFLVALLEEIQRIFLKLKNEGYQISDGADCEEGSFNLDLSKKFDKLFHDVLKSSDRFYENRGVVRVKIYGNVEVGTKVSSEIVASFDDSDGIKVAPGKNIKAVKAYYRIGITHALPWSYKEIDDDGNSYWTGYCVDFARKLSQDMNFDFEFVEPEDGTFGEKVNGKWNGVVGDLYRGETDIAITALIMTADKEEVIDFIPPYYEQTGISIVMRKPDRKTSLFKFMTVLKLEVWLSIVGALIVTGFMLWFVDKYSPYSARNNKKAYPYPCREFTLKESFWFALTSFTPQGGGEAPKSLSGRTLVAAYWLFVVLMLATFTANLAAFLTVERMQTPVQSLEQLSRQSRINYTVVQDSDTHKYFINMKHAEDTLYRMWKELTLNSSTDDAQYRVWDYPIREQYGHILIAINDSNPVANASEGFRLVNEHIDGDFAFIHDSSEIKYEISRNCNLTEVGEVFAEKPYAVAVQQGSHIQDDLSRAILNLQTNRFFEELQAKYWNHSVKGDCPNADDNEGITLESLGGVFIATLFGLVLAMITLVGEVIYYRNKRKKNEQVQTLQIKPSPDMKETFKNNIKLISPETITIGKEFKPSSFNMINSELIKPPKMLYPRSRNRVHQTNIRNAIPVNE
ncbi:ionotropic receptor 25a [Coccinella septempunctata]|uniref:ionotropic receptor 25a n=1 Tax=Coccinella septempunctata TaxID=41139 RepID=UPI001D089D4E|nr:ionotropic receptor 25a [Coccinella septempunctata]